MPVKIKNVIDGSLEEIESKKYNLFIPISLGNLWFNRERVRELALWATEHTRQDVVILVADDIQAINYEVLRNLDRESAVQAAHELGNNFVSMAKRVIRSLPPEKQSLVSVARWQDILTEDFINMQNILKQQYESDKEFQSEIHRIVKTMLNEKAPDDPKLIHRLGDYAIEEMPLMLDGIDVRENHYDIFIYPGMAELDLLVSDIQNRRRFTHVADALNLSHKQPMVDVEVI